MFFFVLKALGKINVYLGVVVPTCNPSTWEAEAGRCQVGSQPGLHSELQASMDNIVSSRPDWAGY
jgi:hypothetical protein